MLPATLAVAAPTTWRITPSPSRVGINDLNGVSCSGPTFCAAVGDHFVGPAGTMIEMWDGRRWSLTRSPSPGQVPNPGRLVAVSCTAARFCAAVGYYASGSLGERTLIEMWDGTRWSVSPSPNPSGYAHLLGVSCTSRSQCEAVGFYDHDCTAHSGGSSGLAETWNGKNWALVPSPRSPCGNTQLQAVSCDSVSRCTAVGSYFRSSSDWTLVEAWHGGRWSIVRSPNANPTNNNALLGVSCTGPRSCVAVGWYQRKFAGPALTIVETWNGTKWSLVASPNPGAPRYSDSLTSVACMKPTDCVAVGSDQYFSTEYAQTLVETWDGTTWRHVRSPNPLAAQELRGVACTSSSSCQAVGEAGLSTDAPDQTLVESGTSGPD
jgi:hypothetical protein